MTLSKLVVSVPLIDGLSDNDDNFASDPPGMIDVAEARWSRDKQTAKRHGFSVNNDIGDGQNVTSAKNLNAIVDLDGIAHAVTSTGTYRQRPTVSAANWKKINVAAPAPSRVVTDPLVRVNAGCAKSDAAIAGNLVCAVWDQIYNNTPTAYYAFWDISTDVPRLVSGPTAFASITEAVRVVVLGSRYFIFAGLDGQRHIYVCAYDSTVNTFTVGSETNLATVDTDKQFGLAPSYDASSFAMVAYKVNAGARTVKKLSTAAAVTATKVLAVSDVQHVLHNGPLSKIVVIGRTGDVDYVDDALAGASTYITPFTNPASGTYTGKFYRATIGIKDTSGNMWAIRSTSGPAARISSAPYATQILKLDTTFAVSGDTLFGGMVLASHFSPLVSETGYAYVGLAKQGTWHTADADPAATPATAYEAYKAAPVAYACALYEDSGSTPRVIPVGRYGQDAIELFGNSATSSALALQAGTPTSHLPHMAYDENATSAIRRLITAYPVRVDDFAGAGTNLVRRAVDIARIEPRTTVPTKAVRAQAVAILGGGNGSTMIDGVDHVELTPPAVEWIAFNGHDSTSTGNSFSFTGVIPPNVQGHIDFSGFGTTWGTPGPGTPNPNRQWGFVVFWRYVDAKGSTHRGPPSSVLYSTVGNLVNGSGYAGKLCLSAPQVTSLTGDTNVTLELEVYACPVDGNGDFRQLGIVRPTVDSSVDEGTVFVTITSNGTATANSVELGVWDYGSATSPLAAVPKSLFTATELEPWQAPALLHICSTASRLWGLNAEDRLDVWYTKPIALGFAPEWSDTLRVRIPEEGGPAVGIAALDDKIVVFKQSRVFVIEGDPGDAAGNNSSMRLPRLVSSDIGCDSVESIVEGPFGVLFHSVRGFFTLDRGLTFNFVGDAVLEQLTNQYTDGNARVVTSASIVPGESEVRYTLDTARGAGNRRGLAYNYRHNRWTRRDASAPTFITTVDGVEWAAIASASGNTIWHETPYDWTVTTAALSMRSSWIKLNGIAGFGRLWRAVFVFRWYANDITIRTAQDYTAETETVKTWSAATLATLVDATTHRVELDVRPTQQKCEAVQFIISESLGQTTTGRGFELIGVTLEVGVKRGAYKRLAVAARS